jgi:hypothetical protein
MPLSVKSDCRASERAVLKGSLLKMSITHKNGNYNRRWREKIVDVSQLAPGQHPSRELGISVFYGIGYNN